MNSASDRLKENIEFIRLVHRISINVLLTCDLLFASRLYRLFALPVLQTALLGTCAALIILYTTYAVFRGFLGRSALVMGGVVLIGAQLYNFSALFGTLVDPAAGFQFIWVLTFIVFFVVCRDGHHEYLASTLFRYASGYTLLYAVLALAYKFDVLPDQIAAPLVTEDSERGKRLTGYLVAASFAWFGWLQRVREQPLGRNVVLLLFCGVAFLVAESRVISLLLIVLTILFVSRASHSKIRFACLSVLALWSVTSVYGLIDRDWNPYALVSSDTSGGFRMWEYELARDMLLKQPVSGIGFAPTQWHAWTFLNFDYFAANDLGLMGVWLDWGLCGLLLFLVGSYVSCIPPSAVSVSLRVPLFFTGCLMAAYGCIAPVIFYPAGATYFAVLLGFWLDEYDNRAPNRPVPDERSPQQTGRT